MKKIIISNYSLFATICTTKQFHETIIINNNII